MCVRNGRCVDQRCARFSMECTSCRIRSVSVLRDYVVSSCAEFVQCLVNNYSRMTRTELQFVNEIIGMKLAQSLWEKEVPFAVVWIKNCNALESSRNFC